MHRLLVAAALAAMLVLGLVVGAWASIPSSDLRIHGCYGTSSNQWKSFILLDKDRGGCPTGWTEVSWVGTSP